MNTNIYVAIDLGSSRISALAAEVLENGLLRIIGDESKASDDIKHGVVEQASGAAFKVNEIVKLLQNSSRIADIDFVSVSIGAKSMKHYPVSVNRFVGSTNIVSDSLIAEMRSICKAKVQGENVYVYDVIPLYYELDGKRVNNPIGLKATQITGKYNAVYGNIKIKDEIQRCFERTGISLEYQPIAAETLSTAVLDAKDRENGCAIINLGATTTTLSVYKEDALQKLLVVPLGGYNITKDIQELGINEANAERLKCLKGSALESMVDNPIYIQIPAADLNNDDVRISTKFLSKIIEARLDEILKPIFNEIELMKSSLASGVIISGGGSKLNYLTNYIAEKTGLEVKFGIHNEWLDENTNEKYFDTRYSQLIGTIILSHENRLLNPLEKKIESGNKNKLPRKGLKERITDTVIKFFGDENKFDDTNGAENKENQTEKSEDSEKQTLQENENDNYLVTSKINMNLFINTLTSKLHNFIDQSRLINIGYNPKKTKTYGIFR